MQLSLPDASARPALVPLVAAASLVVVAAGIALAAPVLGPLLFTLLAAVLCRPGHRALLQRGVPAWLAMLVVAGVYVVTLASLGVVLGIALLDLAADLPAYAAAAPPPPEPVADFIARLAGAITLDEGAVVAAIADLAAALVDAVIFVGFSAIVLAYLLLEADVLRSRLAGVLASGSHVLPAYDRLAAELVAYVKVRAALGGAAAIADTVLLAVLGVPSALLWGLVSFLFSFVPNVGFVVALIPPTILGLLVGGLPTAIAVVVGYTAINLLFDYVLQPRIMGEALDLSAVVVVLSIFAWTWLIGPVGAILAVPLTIVGRALLREAPGLRPLAALLGPPGDPTPAVEASATEPRGPGGPGAPDGSADPPP